jgi:sugar lactone lactonase YvrE
MVSPASLVQPMVRTTEEFLMRHVRWGICIIALLTTLTSLQASPVAAAHGHSVLPDQIDLPNGWQPEGITTDGRSLYAGSLADGAIFRANARTGSGTVLAQGAPGRVAVGLDFDRRRDLLWVAGGPTGEIRAQDADTGRVLATYVFPSATPRFLNDVVVTHDAVYATDSFNQELAVIPLGSGLPPASRATTLPLVGDVVFEGGFNLNGIVQSRGRLLAIQSNTGLLFRINARTGNTHALDLRGADLTNGDGLERDGNLLYVVRNANNAIVAVQLGRHLARGRVVATITDDGFDFPTTVALARHSLFAVNARFSTPPTPDTEYWITRVDALHS